MIFNAFFHVILFLAIENVKRDMTHYNENQS